MTLLVSVVSVAVMGVCSAATAVARPSGTTILPTPAGPHPVGRTILRLIDHDRPDPWHPDRRRELMVTVSYPATAADSHPLGHYVSQVFGAAVSRYLTQTLAVPTRAENYVGLRTNAHDGAPVAAGSFPVLLFSPGLGVPRVFGTAAAEDLASRGYIVISIDHTFEAQAVEFPGGRVVSGITPPTDTAASQRWRTKALAARVEDTRSVIDALTDIARHDDSPASLPDGLVRSIDLTRVGMFGHSLGGFTAAEAMSADPRIRAAVNLDGSLAIDDQLGSAATRGLDRPLLLLASGQVADGGALEKSWGAVRRNSTAWQRSMVLPDSGHYSFTDLQLLIPPIISQLAPELAASYIGTVDPVTAYRTTVDSVDAVFDHFLRGGPPALLDGPSAGGLATWAPTG
ncbi:hypothetical protein VZC37_12980 [Gordonia sp. LSe1-13]|uniref:Lipase n=1 Tax=Gordonia sesuvii TaxID=3116777 RepID=A0ABU7MDY7_9ACTN|nr:hypothetical protein [Gordonia sp. LSe1-13]